MVNNYLLNGRYEIGNLDGIPTDSPAVGRTANLKSPQSTSIGDVIDHMLDRFFQNVSNGLAFMNAVYGR